MYWINFLHLYQPANIESEKIVAATKHSYERIVRALEEHPDIKFTLNISGCLLLRWAEEFHYDGLILRIKKLIENGQVELVGSAAYHTLLPLSKLTEAEAQIVENENILKKYFGNELKLRGFFFPEMAYGHKVAKLVKKLGYQWAIVDEISLNGKLGQLDTDQRYIDKNSGLELVFRQRNISETYVPETLAKEIKEKKLTTAITASDAELYGLHYIDHTAEFEKLLKTKDLVTLTISEFINGKENFKKIDAVEASWQSSEQELADKQPYILWSDKKNEVHRKLWQLVALAEKTNKESADDPNLVWARWHLVRGMASCVFWWASGRDFSPVFGPIAWNPDEIEKGVNELIRSIRTLENSTNLVTKVKAEKLAMEIRKLVWHTHWNFYRKK
ncbi:MAG: hypothetical protein UT48_C0001G0056 [Parcubacteria group bacterium GW2011_GWE2_39_37]|uniref:Glycoside hydrolase family 57 N-terminal domain-containing protein n=1 Tax=Candidatus Falkowbacteria bacterium GW2011_GWF2_39_8 TaxID=1618642 RepID=A0A0G0Q0V6_9BACT|nr:MAG: hypothetical protein UT48_C0001G0056 [Parcubacteria group bacterium GW2011_GWE2_39_37]KKR33793.1 MAG: hypothetical protein UT64_C0003G0014 [Candidatus Falkowbacteria bacterium GW2011_GWF2_39_8]